MCGIISIGDNMYPTLQSYINRYYKNYRISLIVIFGGIALIATLMIITEISSVMIVIFLLIMVIITPQIIIQYKKNCARISNLNNDTKNELEKELNNLIVISNNNYTLTENLIFIHSSFEWIRYEDILLIYERTRLKNHSIDTYVTLIGSNKRIYCLPTSTTSLTINYELYDIKEIVIEKNNKVLVEKTKNNKKILNEKYRIDLEELL